MNIKLLDLLNQKYKPAAVNAALQRTRGITISGLEVGATAAAVNKWIRQASKKEGASGNPRRS